MGRGEWAKKGICAAGKMYFFSVLPKKTIEDSPTKGKGGRGGGGRIFSPLLNLSLLP